MDNQELHFKSFPAEKISYFKKNDLEYWLQSIDFDPLIEQKPNFQHIENQINVKQKTYSIRHHISSIFNQQYSNTKVSDAVKENIEKLSDERTFSICCAHQPLLLTGPAYFIYKICSTISVSKQLNNKFPNYHFVPVFYCGAEDHDLLEINEVNFFSQKLSWRQEVNKVSGRQNLDGLDEIIDQLESIFKFELNSQLFVQKLRNFSSLKENQYADFYREMINDMFGHYGLLFFNPDDTFCKHLFSPIMCNEVEARFTQNNVLRTEKIMSQMGIVPQAGHREINLFYIDEQDDRTRIIETNGRFHTTEGQDFGTLEHLKERISKEAQNFSTNVLLRPLYQEFILPNVAFVGGGAEISYWMQLRLSFQSQNISFPILLRRLSAQYLDKNLNEQISALGLNFEDFLDGESKSKEKYLSTHSKFPSNIHSFKDQLQQSIDALSQSDEIKSGPQQQTFEIELKKLQNQLHQFENKLLKSVQEKHDIQLKKIEKIHKQIFPQDNLQERVQGGLIFYFKFGDTLLEKLIQVYQPEVAEYWLYSEATGLE